jgi:hypothetical protein
MIRTQLYLPEQLHRDLTLTARRKRESFAELVRKFLQEKLDDNRAEGAGSTSTLLKIAGKCKAKTPGDLSKNITSYLYGAKSPNYGSKSSKK